MFDVIKIRKDFPLLCENKPPIYFDNACMPLRPKQVIKAVTDYYTKFPACAGRSNHTLSRIVDEKVHATRVKMQKFIGAKDAREVVFVKNTTEAINIVARSFPFNKGDVILTSGKEHNSNLLVWQLRSKDKGIVHDVIPFNDDNTFNLDALESLLVKHKGKVKLVSLAHTSNLDGVSVPAKDIVKLCHEHGAKVLFDCAQAIAHKPFDVIDVDADFICFSGHKMMGPTGIGVLYGKLDILEMLSHDTVGGESVTDSTYVDAKWGGLPHKFEAGLQHYAGIIGLGAACDYISSIGKENILVHEIKLNEYVTKEFVKIPEITLIGPKEAELRSGVISFTIAGWEPSDVGMFLDEANIMLRCGHHCVSSWFNHKKIKGSIRASFNVYNTLDEVKAFVNEIKKIIAMRK